MGKKITYIHLPIYSIATYLQYMYFSGGGGGSTGIPNEIFIFHRQITKDPVHRISTGSKICENMNTSVKFKKMVCSWGKNISIFKITQNGKNLEQQHSFEVDTSLKNPTINCIALHESEMIFAVGGDDCFIRYFSMKDNENPILHWEHSEHYSPVRSIQSNGNSLFVSTDMEQVVISNFRKKMHIRKVYIDQLNPEGCMFQSAYFLSSQKLNGLDNEKDQKLVFCHYIPRKQTFVSKQLESGKIFTLELSKDQSCNSAIQQKYLGVACGKGTTYFVDVEEMKVLNRQKGHSFITTAAIMTKGHRFITGTPQCSYLIQNKDESYQTLMLKIILFVIIFLAMGLKTTGASDQL